MKLETLISASLILSTFVGCDVEQDLGETASGSSTGAGTDDGTAGSAETGVLDTGPWDDTGDSTTSVGTTGGSAETGVLDTGPWDDTGDATTGGPVGDCSPAAGFISWDGNGLAPEDLDFGGTFVGVGSCSPTLSQAGTTTTVALACTLSGTRDGQDFVDEDITTEVTLQTSGRAQLQGLWPVVVARFFVGSDGFAEAASRYLVLEQPMFPNDADAPILIASQGFALAPTPAQFVDWYDGDWYGGPTFTSADATCATGDAPRCGFDVAIAGGWLDEAPTEVHGTQMGTFGAPTEGGTYDLYVETAWQAPNSFECGEDFPGASYRFVAVGATPQ